MDKLLSRLAFVAAGAALLFSLWGLSHPPHASTIDVHYTGITPVHPRLGASVGGNPVTGSGSTVNGGPVPPVPASPHYYVSNAGNDGNTCLSTSSPCLTVQQPLTRLALSSWSGQPTVTVLNAITGGATPIWYAPVPPVGASPILIQGTAADSGLGEITATGGTNTTNFPPVLPTVTTAAATFTANAQNGRIVVFDTGSNVGFREVIHTNSTAQLNIVGYLAGAPANGDTFHINKLVGTYSYTGNMFIVAPGGVLLDQLELDGGGAVYTSGTVQATAMRYIAGASTPMGLVALNGVYFDNPAYYPGVVPPLFPQPSSVVSCGSRFDGSANAFYLGAAGHGFVSPSGHGSIRMDAFSANAVYVYNFASPDEGISLDNYNAMTGSGFSWIGAPFILQRTVLTNPVEIPGIGGTAVLQGFDVPYWQVNFDSINGAPASTNIIQCDLCIGYMSYLTGTNTGAGVAFTVTHSRIELADPNTSTTMTGGTASTDVVVGTNSAHSLAQIASTAADRVDTNTATYFGP
jgi:hypothetical protein